MLTRFRSATLLALAVSAAPALAQVGPATTSGKGPDDTNTVTLKPFPAFQINTNSPTVDGALTQPDPNAPGTPFDAAGGWTFNYATPAQVAATLADLTVTVDFPWVVTEPNIPLPNNTTINGRYTNQDVGGNHFIFTYTPKPGDPATVHFISAYNQSINGGPRQTFLDNLHGVGTPFYDTNGGAAGTLPNGTSWFADAPADPEPEPVPDAPGSNYTADVHFETMLATDSLDAMNNHVVTIYGGYSWGYTYTAHDPVNATTNSISGNHASWQSASTWQNGDIPVDISDLATLANNWVSGGNLTLDGPVDISGLNILNQASINIAPGTATDPFKLNGAGDVAAITAARGLHTISAPVELDSSVSIDIANGASLTISGVVSGIGGITKTNNGALTLSAPNTFTGGITLSAGSLILANPNAAAGGNLTVQPFAFAQFSNNLNTAILLSNLTLGGSTNAWTGTINLGNNPLVIEPTGLDRASLIANLKNQVTYAINHPTGGIHLVLSSNKVNVVIDNAYAGLASFHGRTTDPNAILIAQLFPGDANADNQVNITDLNILGTHWEQPVHDWSQADFNNDGKVDVLDLNIAANHWLAGAGPAFDSPSPAAPLPEPTSLLLLALPLALRRRR